MKPVRNHLKLLTAAACFLLAAATGFSGEEKTAAFPFYKDITLPEHPNDISVFTIDADIWRELRLDTVVQAGIRIVGPDGEFRPFDMWREEGLEPEREVMRHYPDATITGFETLPDGSVRISASLDAQTAQRFSDLGDAQVIGLRIRTSAKDFDKKVRVFDGSGETRIAEGAFLDYSSRVNLRNDTIMFPAPVPVKESSFVIVMDNYTEIKDSPRFRVVEGDSSILEQEKYRESPKIDGIELQIAEKKSSARVWRTVSSPVTILSREKKGNTTVVKFSNGSACLDSITVDSSDVFFSRQYRLYDDSGNIVAPAPARSSTKGYVRKMDTAAFHTSPFDRTIPVLHSSTNRSKVWTLELDNGEYNELKDLVITANEPVYQIRFLSVPAASGETDASPSGYRVYYGGKAPYVAPPPEFKEAAASMNYLKDPVRADSTLSEQKENPGFDESGVPLVKDWGLVYKIIMAAAALAVFLILLFSVKKIDKVEG